MKGWKEIELLFELPRGGGELLRVTLDKWIGKRTYKNYSFRIWYKTQDGDVRPTSKGFTVKEKDVVEMVNALKSGHISVHGNTTKIMSD